MTRAQPTNILQHVDILKTNVKILIKKKTRMKLQVTAAIVVGQNGKNIFENK
jgi:hypothetical protein